MVSDRLLAVNLRHAGVCGGLPGTVATLELLRSVLSGPAGTPEELCTEVLATMLSRPPSDDVALAERWGTRYTATGKVIWSEQTPGAPETGTATAGQFS